MPSSNSELKPARKTSERPLGFRAGDWLISPLTSGGYFTGYVVGTAGPSILLRPVQKRFETVPTLQQLDLIDDNRLAGTLRLTLGPYRLNWIQRIESRESRELSGQLPVVYAEPAFWINRWPRFYWYERADSLWHVRITTELPHEEFGEQASMDPCDLTDYLDRLTPDRELRYSEGDWYGFQVGKNRWAAGFVEDIRPPAQLILRVPYIVLDREIIPDDLPIMRSSESSKPLVVSDEGIQSGNWTRLGWEPPLREGEFGWHGGARLRFLDPELPLERQFDPLGVLSRTPFVSPEFRAGDFNHIHSAEMLAMILRSGSVLLPSRPWRPDAEPKPPVKKRGQRKKPYQEGDWFLVPLKHGGSGLGRIARCAGSEVIAFLFGGRHDSAPDTAYLEELRSDSAVDVVIIFDDGLTRGDWMILRQSGMWKREEWTPPPFSFECEGIPWCELREHPDGDPSQTYRSWRVSRSEARKYPHHATGGKATTEFVLDLWALPNDAALRAWAETYTELSFKARPDGIPPAPTPVEGEWFALRLDRGGWALGRVARTDGYLMVVYLFGKRLRAIPDATDIVLPSAADAILIQRTGLEISPLGEIAWLGRVGSWNPIDWPIPRLKREIRGVGGHCVGLSYSFDRENLGMVVDCQPATIVELESLAEYSQLTLYGIARYLDSAIEPLR